MRALRVRAPARARHLACRRTGAARRRFPGRARGPCRRSARCRRAGLADRARDRRGAVALDRDALRCGEAGEDLGDDRVAVLAARVVVGDDRRRRRWRSAIAAICGRLPRSRSPPQPNTQIRRAARVRAQRLSAPAPAHRACARSRPRRSGCRAVAAEAVHAAGDRLQPRQRRRDLRPALRRAHAARRPPRAGCRR